MNAPEVEIPLSQHLYELRRCFLRVFGVIALGVVLAMLSYTKIFALILSTLPIETSQHGKPVELVLLGPAEGVAIFFRVVFWVGLCATSPIWLYFLFQFVTPALTQRERRYLLPFCSISLLLFALGTITAHVFSVPIANTFFLSFNENLGRNLWALSHYIDYYFTLLLGNALAFEATILLFFTVHLGIFTAQQLSSYRKAMIVTAFVLGALLTPPDVLTQLLVAVPLTIFYELAILYAKLRERRAETKIPKDMGGV